MANFQTHLNGAAIVSGLTAAVLLSAGHTDPVTAIWLTCLGSIGGLLPDIDSKHSKAMKVIFRALGIIVSFALLCHFYSTVPLLELLFIVIGAYCFIRYGLRKFLGRFTVHRGSCHSIAFVAVIAMFITALMGGLGYTPIVSWFSGLFVFLGGLVHLTLDEMYSVDLANKRIKKSFGTAFRPICTREPLMSLIQITSLVLLFGLTPPLHTTLKALTEWHQFAFGPNWLNFHDAENFVVHFYHTITQEIRHWF
jgi:hypothetical protein